MNETLLNGILNLFPIQAAMHPATDRVRERVFLERYLRRHLLLSQPEIYLDLYDAALNLHQDSETEQLLESAAKVAGALRSKLPRFEQFVFLMRFVELADHAGEDQAAGLVARVVADRLNIAGRVAEETALLCRAEFRPEVLTSNFLVVMRSPPTGQPPCRCLVRPGFHGSFKVLCLSGPGSHFLKAAHFLAAFKRVGSLCFYPHFQPGSAGAHGPVAVCCPVLFDVDPAGLNISAALKSALTISILDPRWNWK